MNRRGFLLGAGALAAPSIIGISGIIQLSRPGLVRVANGIQAEIDPRFTRLTSIYPMGIVSPSDWADWVPFMARARLVP